MAANFAVTTVFKAKDRISGAFKRMGKGADDFARRSDKAFKKSSRSANRFKDIVKGILVTNVISRGFRALETGIGTALVEFANFDQAILSASAKFKGLNLATLEGKKTFNELKDMARKMGDETEFSAAQAASGLDFLALAGFNAQQAIAALPGTLNLATAANIDLGRATDIATDSLGAFGLMTKDSIQLQKNLTRVNDVMAKTMATSNTNIEQLFEAVAAGAADFTTAGQSMETFSALVGIMANAGKKGESAGTALRNIMVRLAAPTKQAAAILNKYNVQTQDQAGNFRDVVDILGDFGLATKKLGTAQRTAAISTVFGLRAQGAINILLKAGSKQMKNYREELKQASGSSQKMADIMRSSLINRLKTLRSALIELSFKVFEEFSENGKDAITNLTEAIREIDVKPLVEGLKDVISLLKQMKDIAVFLTETFKTLNFFSGGFFEESGFNLRNLLEKQRGPSGFGAQPTVFPTKEAEEEFKRNIPKKEETSLFGGLFSNQHNDPQQVVQPLAPNAASEEVMAKFRQVDIGGLLRFENAPEGTSFTPSAGNKIKTSGLGAQ